MAILFADGFDHYTTGSAKGWAGSVWSIGGSGRNSGNCFAEPFGGVNNTMYRDFTTANATVIVGMAVLNANVGALKQFCFIQSAGGAGTHAYWQMNGGFAQVFDANGTMIGASPIQVTNNTFHYYELKITVGNSAAWELRQDGATVASGSGADLQAGAATTAGRLMIAHGFSDTTAARIDDLYIIDGSGTSPNNDFLGDVRIQTLLPNGNGNSSQFVGSDADSTNNYLLVDEAAPNDDTDYVESQTVGDKDTYAYQDLTGVGTVYGVQILPWWKKSDAGNVRKLVSTARLSTTEVDSAAQTLSTSYVMYQDLRETKPGGGAWTITDVNNAEFGVKVDT